MDIKGQFWNDDDSEGDNESEEFLYGVQGSCAADLYRHPQLDADIEAVKEIYSENSVSIRWGSTSGMAGGSATNLWVAKRVEVFLYGVMLGSVDFHKFWA